MSDPCSLVDAFAASTEATLRAIAGHGSELALITAGTVAAYAITRHYIPTVAQILFQSNLFGVDINKTTAEQRRAFAEKRHRGAAFDEQDVEFRALVVPESLGILCGGVYLSVVVVLVLLLQPAAALPALSGPLTTIAVMLLLGFVDDVLDVRWRYKMVLSMLGTLPLVIAYDGSTSVLVPPAIVAAFGRGSSSSTTAATSDASGGALAGLISSISSLLDSAALLADGKDWLLSSHLLSSSVSAGGVLLYLGPLYLVYIVLLCTFCTNSINILAGVNGVEVGQSIVIAAASVVYNLCQLRLEADGVLDPAVRSSSPWLSSDHQIRALLLLMPFLGVSAALWQANKYPARIFVGDSYTYFAGTVLAVASVTGVYSKTLLLFFVPQLINFTISIPQLFGLVVCPRHRVPTWSPATNLLTSSGNLTLLNLILVVAGAMGEGRLTSVVLALQALTCGFGFLVRYVMAARMYESVQ